MARAATARRGEPSMPDEDTDLVGHYLTQIGKTQLLTADDEVRLAKQIEAGVYADQLLQRGEEKLAPRRRDDLEEIVAEGNRAKSQMIRANLRLVVATAKKYPRRGMSFLDIIQEGNIGLIRAVEKFDYTKGFKFSTYAVWWIRQAIERGVAEQTRTIRVPVHVVEQLSRFDRVERRMEVRLGRAPTPEELAAEVGTTAERIIELRSQTREAVSLDTPVGTEGDTSLGHLIEDEHTISGLDVLETQEMASELRALVDTLTPREALIVTRRFGLTDGRQRTLQEVADEIGLTKERIRQLEKQALAQLRDPRHNRPLMQWAG